MKKICFFSGDITRGGGTESVAALIANTLAAQGQYEICFLSLVEERETPLFPIQADIRRYVLGKKWIQPGPAYLSVLPKLRSFLKKQQIDVVIDIDIVLDALSVPVTRGLKTKVVSWGHFSYFFEEESLYRRLILRFATKRADYCITINQENQTCYETRLHRTEGVCTIYNPIVCGRNKGEENSPDQTGKENIIFWVGRLEPVKGVDYLAEIADKVLKQLPDWKWLVAGDGSQRKWLEDFIREHDLQQQLILLGRVKELKPYYEKAKLFVLTSHSEGLPVCLLEAKGYGLPCVSFDIRTGPKEIIRDGVNGYLVSPYDCEEMAEKIGKLAKEETLRRQFAEKTALEIEKFELKTVINSWNEVLKSLCG